MDAEVELRCQCPHICWKHKTMGMNVPTNTANVHVKCQATHAAYGGAMVGCKKTAGHDGVHQSDNATQGYHNIRWTDPEPIPKMEPLLPVRARGRSEAAKSVLG